MTDWTNAFVWRDAVNVIGRCHFALDDAQGSSFIKAIKGAHISILGAFNQGKRSFKHFITNGTDDLYRCVFSLTAQGIRAFAGASCFSPPFKSGFIGGIFNAAHRTIAFYLLTHRAIITHKCFMRKVWDE
jgi:hypothetical protein